MPWKAEILRLIIFWNKPTLIIVLEKKVLEFLYLFLWRFFETKCRLKANKEYRIFRRLCKTFYLKDAINLFQFFSIFYKYFEISLELGHHLHCSIRGIYIL